MSTQTQAARDPLAQIHHAIANHLRDGLASATKDTIDRRLRCCLECDEFLRDNANCLRYYHSCRSEANWFFTVIGHRRAKKSCPKWTESLTPVSPDPSPLTPRPSP